MTKSQFRLNLSTAALLTGLFALASTQAAPRAKVTALPDSNFAKTVSQFEDDYSSLRQFYNLEWSPVRFDRMDQHYQEWLKKLEATDYNALNAQGRVDYWLLRNFIQRSEQRQNRDRQRLQEMQDLLPFRDVIQKLELARWHMETLNPETAATELATIPDQVKKIRDRIEAGRKDKEKDKDSAAKKKEQPEGSETVTNLPPLKVTPVLAHRSAAAIGAVQQTLRNWFTSYNGYQPDFSWWTQKPYEEANKALEEFAKYLREEIAGLKGKPEDPLIGESIGEAALQKEIQAEFLPYTARELIAIADREFAWCEDQLAQAAREMGVADGKAALAKIKLQHVPPGQQDELVAKEGRAAIRFVKEHDLVTVPPLCEETWRLTLLSSEQQKTMPYVAYGGQSILVAYAREDMKHEDKLMSMRGNNQAFMHIVVPHELVPGHHLQMYIGSRHQPQRGLFGTPFFVEGWALYWELRLWDLQYARSPEDRAGMLFWRMHRCARIIVSLKFHLGEMKPQEMVDFLVYRVGHEKLGATSEVRRYIGDAFSPLYQAAYMLGGIQLYALHQEVVKGRKMSERDFHDTVLKQGSIPVTFIRALVQGQTLPRDPAPGWRFAEGR